MITFQMRNERGTHPLSEHQTYVALVDYRQRDRFPMLGHIDPFGTTIFNRLQVDALSLELQTIKNLVERIGVEAAVVELGTTPEHLGADESNYGRWNPVMDLLPLVEILLDVCVRVRERPHRLLWFVGD